MFGARELRSASSAPSGEPSAAKTRAAMPVPDPDVGGARSDFQTTAKAPVGLTATVGWLGRRPLGATTKAGATAAPSSSKSCARTCRFASCSPSTQTSTKPPSLRKATCGSRRPTTPDRAQRADLAQGRAVPAEPAKEDARRNAGDTRVLLPDDDAPSVAVCRHAHVGWQPRRPARSCPRRPAPALRPAYPGCRCSRRRSRHRRAPVDPRCRRGRP